MHIWAKSLFPALSNFCLLIRNQNKTLRGGPSLKIAPGVRSENRKFVMTWVLFFLKNCHSRPSESSWDWPFALTLRPLLRHRCDEERGKASGRGLGEAEMKSQHPQAPSRTPTRGRGGGGREQQEGPGFFRAPAPDGSVPKQHLERTFLPSCSRRFPLITRSQRDPAALSLLKGHSGKVGWK